MGTGLPDYYSRVLTDLPTKFIDLQDAPPTYVGNDAKNLRVNDVETELEFGGAYLEYGLAAAIGAAGRVGRIYWATDTKILYWDNGTAWVEILRSEAVSRLASLSERSFASLTNVDVTGKSGLLADDQHVLDSEVLAVISQYLPWWIDINPFMSAKANVNWSDIISGALGICYGISRSSGAQNDSIAWDVVLAVGTWTIQLLHYASADRGIYSVQFDSVEKGTIDGYRATAEADARNSVTGIVVSASAKIELKLKMATKNASSDGYYGSIKNVRLIRTA